MNTPRNPEPSTPTWPAPGPAAPIHGPADDTVTVPHRSRRRQALGAVAVVALAAASGAAGGALAGRSSAGSQHATSPATPPAASATPLSTSDETAKTDVSELIDRTLPSVVSISVTLPGKSGAGTGFVVDPGGLIATNAHVVADATDIQVEFADGTTAPATIVGVDRTDDLAVVKVDKSGLPALELGHSSLLTMGEPVVAIGNALDLTGGPTATEGIVSALDRSIDTDDGEHLDHLVQTDAAINPGNSGGPLLTFDGKVVGINSAGSRDAQNIGFAIAVDTARPIIEQLEQGKTVTKPYLGVSTLAIDDAVAAHYGLDDHHGLFIVDVAGGSAADAAGLQAGDVIVEVNGNEMDDPVAFGETIRATGAGNELTLTVHRAGETIEIKARLSSHVA